MNLYDSGITDAVNDNAITVVQYDCTKNKDDIQRQLHSDSFERPNNVMFISVDREITNSYLTPLVWANFIRPVRDSIEKINRLLVNYKIIEDNGEIVIQDQNGQIIAPALMNMFDSLLLVLSMRIIRYLSTPNPTQYLKYFSIENISPYLHGPWLNKFIDFIKSMADNHHVKFIIFTEVKDAGIIYDKLKGADVRSVFLLDIEEENKV